MKAKKKASIRTLTKSGLALLLSAILFISFTYAWFTLSVKNEKNKISTGDLKLSVIGYDSNEEEGYNLAADKRKDLSKEEEFLIKEENWKPNQYDVKYVCIENAGSLDLKFSLLLHVVGYDPTISNLAEVIMVKADSVGLSDLDAGTQWDPKVDPTDPLNGFERLSRKLSAKDKGTWEIATDELIGSGDPPGYKWYRIEYYMCPWAGNTYQGKTLEMDLVVAGIQASTDIDNLIFVWDEKSFLDAIGNEDNAGATIVFLNDIEITDYPDPIIEFKVPLNYDLNGHWLRAPGKTLLFNDKDGCSMDIADGHIEAYTIEFDNDGKVINLGNDPDGPLYLHLDKDYTYDDEDGTIVHDNQPEKPEQATIIGFEDVRVVGGGSTYPPSSPLDPAKIMLEGTIVYSDGPEPWSFTAEFSPDPTQAGNVQEVLVKDSVTDYGEWLKLKITWQPFPLNPSLWYFSPANVEVIYLK